MDLYVGVMSGTSVDGVDAVLAAFDANDARPRVVSATAVPIDAALRDQLLGLQASGPDELHRAAVAANGLVDVYADAVGRALALAGVRATDVAAIGAHGQTVRHRPELGYTIQINAPARLAERTGIRVVADFRSRDVAAGGHGAPLAPAFHAVVFRHPTRHRLVLNLGGMSNVTDLPSARGAVVRGWDCGPGNVLLDWWHLRHRGAPFDRGGAWAASGRVDAALLARCVDDPWFADPPPKSTGRDRFDAGWVERRLVGFEHLAPEDVQATLAETTAATVVDASLAHAGAFTEVVVCGGGAYNDDLMSRLARRFAVANRTIAVRSSAALDDGGVAPEHVEALAFAWLARRRIEGRAGNLSEVTGAAGPRVLGAIHAA